jgi:adenine phosphoribosyltransferase
VSTLPQTQTTIASSEDLKKLIREIPDYPKPGILFYDITTLIKDRAGFARVVDYMTSPYLDKNIDLVLGMEARGFIFGPAMAYRLNAGFIPVRKPKKLPGETVGNSQGCHSARPTRANRR